MNLLHTEHKADGSVEYTGLIPGMLIVTIAPAFTFGCAAFVVMVVKIFLGVVSA
jgi:hypothetical protein